METNVYHASETRLELVGTISVVFVKKGAVALVALVYSVFRGVCGPSRTHLGDFLRVERSVLECSPTAVATAVGTAIGTAVGTAVRTAVGTAVWTAVWTAVPGIYRGVRPP